MASITELGDFFNTPKPHQENVDLAARFFEHLTTWLVDDYPKLQKEREAGLHASSLWKTCARQHILVAAHKINTKEKFEAGSYLTFDIGHAMHHWWQNNYLGPMQVLHGNWHCKRCDKITFTGLQPEVCPACKANRREVLDYSELPVRDEEMRFVGHCDGVLHLGDFKAVFEFKTASPSEYDKLTQPKLQHMVQAHAYMHGLKLQHTLVVYLNKGSQCEWKKDANGWQAGRPKVKVFHVKFDAVYWQNYVKRCKDHKTADDLVRSLPVVTPEHALKFERICAHQRSPLAEDCDVAAQCFSTKT